MRIYIVVCRISDRPTKHILNCITVDLNLAMANSKKLTEPKIRKKQIFKATNLELKDICFSQKICLEYKDTKKYIKICFLNTFFYFYSLIMYHLLCLIYLCIDCYEI